MLCRKTNFEGRNNPRKNKGTKISIAVSDWAEGDINASKASYKIRPFKHNTVVLHDEAKFYAYSGVERCTHCTVPVFDHRSFVDSCRWSGVDVQSGGASVEQEWYLVVRWAVSKNRAKGFDAQIWARLVTKKCCLSFARSGFVYNNEWIDKTICPY